tara:strand:- start:4905 stop:5561 length:657 start_codon:yes stop_codon:yes gene_type:complete
MKNNTQIFGPIIEPTSGVINNIVLFLHGYGANGEDLINIGEHWKKNIPNTIFYSPNAPFTCDINPNGFQWFPLNKRTEDELKEGLQKASPFLEKFTLNILEKHSLKLSDLIVVGFSQGTILSLYNFTTKKAPIGGLIGYSGLFYNDEKEDESKINFPILLHHGEDDEIISSNFTKKAEDILIKRGFNVESVIKKNLGHGIDQNGLELGEKFIRNVLKL